MATSIDLRAAAEAEIFIYEGDTTPMEVAVSTSDDIAVPVDLTGIAIKMQVRKVSDNTVVVELSTADGDIDISGDDNNIFTVSGLEAIPYATVNSYKYDIQFVDVGEITTYLYGKIQVQQQVTT